MQRLGEAAAAPPVTAACRACARVIAEIARASTRAPTCLTHAWPCERAASHARAARRSEKSARRFIVSLGSGMSRSRGRLDLQAAAAVPDATSAMHLAFFHGCSGRYKKEEEGHRQTRGIAINGMGGAAGSAARAYSNSSGCHSSGTFQPLGSRRQAGRRESQNRCPVSPT